MKAFSVFRLGLAMKVNVTFNPVHIALLGANCMALPRNLSRTWLSNLGKRVMSYLSEHLGCAIFLHSINTRRYMKQSGIYTSKVSFDAFFRVSTLR
jgi:hypothetical protein